MNELTSYLGPPEVLVTDRGTAYTSHEFQRYCKNNYVTHRLNAGRTPRANGQVERINRTILSILTTMTKDDKTWDEKLRDIQWSLNTMKSSVTRHTQQQLLYNFTPRDAMQNKLILALHEVNPPTDEDIQLERNLAAQRINAARAKAKVRFDARHRKPQAYDVGDLVLAENEQPSIDQSRKLETSFKGPFIVTKVLGKDRYVVEDLPKSRRTKQHYFSVFASDKLNRWCELLNDLTCDDDNDEAEGERDQEEAVYRDAHL